MAYGRAAFGKSAESEAAKYREGVYYTSDTLKSEKEDLATKYSKSKGRNRKAGKRIQKIRKQEYSSAYGQAANRHLVHDDRFLQKGIFRRREPYAKGKVLLKHYDPHDDTKTFSRGSKGTLASLAEGASWYSKRYAKRLKRNNYYKGGHSYRGFDRGGEGYRSGYKGPIQYR